MKTKDYYPQIESQIPIWMDTFRSKLNEHSGLLEISPSVLTQLQTDLKNVKLEIGNVDTLKKNY